MSGFPESWTSDVSVTCHETLVNKQTKRLCKEVALSNHPPEPSSSSSSSSCRSSSNSSSSSSSSSSNQVICDARLIPRHPP